MRVTLKEVARRAGVSIATASYVLNEGPRPVGSATRARVLEAMRELRYEPSGVAQSLRTGRSIAIGVLVPDIDNALYTPIVRGVENVARRHGYRVILSSTEEDPEEESAYLRVLWTNRVTKFVVVPTTQGGEGLRTLKDAGATIVIVNRLAGYEPFDSVGVDNVSGAYAATKHLISLGHRRIATITGPLHISTAIDRWEGFRRAMLDHGLPVDDDLVKSGTYSEQTGLAHMPSLITGPNRPSAVFIGSSQILLGAVRVLREHNVRVPQDLAVAAYGDPDWASLVDPPLTVVRQELRRIGTIAGELLLTSQAENGPQRQPQKIVLEPTLIVRRSTTG